MMPDWDMNGDTTRAGYEGQITRLQARVSELETALQFYASAWKFKPNKRFGGLEWSPTEDLLEDCGNRARSALLEGGR